MKKLDDGIFISYKEIEDMAKAFGYIALALVSIRSIRYLLVPVVLRVKT